MTPTLHDLIASPAARTSSMSSAVCGIRGVRTGSSNSTCTSGLHDSRLADRRYPESTTATIAIAPTARARAITPFPCLAAAEDLPACASNPARSRCALALASDVSHGSRAHGIHLRGARPRRHLSRERPLSAQATRCADPDGHRRIRRMASRRALAVRGGRPYTIAIDRAGRRMRGTSLHDTVAMPHRSDDGSFENIRACRSTRAALRRPSRTLSPLA